MSKTLEINSKKYGIVTVIFDDEDMDLINKYKWQIKGGKNKYYAIASFYSKKDKNTSHIFMHNMIMGVIGIDHINGNGCDNRRCNLRIATQSQNSKNMQLSRLNKFGVKGVSYCKAKNKYSVHITCDYKHIFLGYYSCLIEAALKYNEAAIKYHGEFANLNLINEQEIERLKKFDLGVIIKRRKGKTSKHKGISVVNGKYRARLIRNGKEIKIGIFINEEDAVQAYNLAKTNL